MKDIHLYEKVPPTKNNFSVKFMEFYNSRYLAPHWHEHLEIAYFLSGSCNYTCNGKTFAVGADDFVVVNSTEIHSLVSDGTVSYFCMLIYPEFFTDVDYSPKTKLENLIHKDEFIRDTIKKMYEEYAGGEVGSDMILKGNAYQLMAYLMRNYTATQLSKKDSLMQESRLDRLNKILDYISCHYQEKITNSQLARLCYISQVHLCRFFKSNIGKSTTEYINEYRIEKAVVMLTNTDENISDIALSVGFEDVNYFSRTFKKIKKVTPTAFRETVRNM